MPDPDAIPTTNPQALAYMQAVEALGERVAGPAVTLSYGPDRGQHLEVYAPDGAENLPILVFFHGGSWISGELSWLRFMAPAVLQMPAILVAGGYRLAPRLQWPAQIEDVAAALHVVARDAQELGGNPARIVVGGHSAGAHLAALAALKGLGPPLKACFPVSGPMDLRYGDIPLDAPKARAYRYLLRSRDQDAEASPNAFVSAAAPPFHLLWGEQDFEHIIASNLALAEALSSAGRPASREILPGASHFDTHLALADPGAPWYARLRAAFDAP